MRRSWLWVTLLGVLVPVSGYASDTNYQDYVLGGRAVGLGGAFTAIANDPSGIFYNPAGLVDSSRTSLQISTNLYGIEVNSGSGLFGQLAERIVDLDTVFTELNIIPSTAGAVDTFGTPMADGRARHAYGLGVFVPSYRSYAADTTGPGTNEEETLAYQSSLLDRTIMAGAAYAYRVDRIWSFGISGFGAYRARRQLEETTLFSNDEQTRAFTSAQTSTDLYVVSLLLELGIKAQINDRWSFGLSVSTPSIRLFDNASVRIVRSSGAPGEDGSYQIESLENLDADTEFGTTLRVGGAFIIPKKATLTLDVVFYGPANYELVSIPSTSQLKDSLTITTDIDRNFAANVNVGFEYLWRPHFSTSTGLFTNFSSAPKIPGETGALFDEDRLPNINGLGGSFVLGFFSKHTLTRAGVMMSYAAGSDVIAQQQELQPIGSGGDFKKVDIQQLQLYVFISSTFRY